MVHLQVVTAMVFKEKGHLLRGHLLGSGGILYCHHLRTGAGVSGI